MHTVESLLKRAAELEASDGRSLAERREEPSDMVAAKAAWLEANGFDSRWFIGKVPDDVFPLFQKGEEITILKGTLLRGTFPQSQRNAVDHNNRSVKRVGRTYKVTVHDADNGHIWPEHAHRTKGVGYDVRQPEIIFVGAGGYYHHVDMNDVPEAIERHRELLAAKAAKEELSEEVNPAPVMR